MTVIDTFGAYVRSRLDGWGDEFALCRDCEYLGHQSKNILQVLIEHKGEMPGRAQGYKPLEVNLEALEIERMVAEIARDRPDLSCCLRAYHCGSGRRKVERYETALMLLAHACPTLRLPRVRQYMDMVSDGQSIIRGMLIQQARAA